jgi:hypothetical protein
MKDRLRLSCARLISGSSWYRWSSALNCIAPTAVLSKPYFCETCGEGGSVKTGVCFGQWYATTHFKNLNQQVRGYRNYQHEEFTDVIRA